MFIVRAEGRGGSIFKIPFYLKDIVVSFFRIFASFGVYGKNVILEQLSLGLLIFCLIFMYNMAKESYGHIDLASFVYFYLS